MLSRLILILMILAGLAAATQLALVMGEGGGLAVFGLLGTLATTLLFVLAAFVGLAICGELADTRKAASKHHDRVEGHLQALGTMLEARLRAVDGLAEEIGKATVAHHKVVEQQLGALCEMNRDRAE